MVDFVLGFGSHQEPHPIREHGKWRSSLASALFWRRGNGAQIQRVSASLVAFHGSVSMCDYSLHAVATRPAKVAETLVSSGFYGTTTHGFAGIDEPAVAVCLRPGTEIAFEANVQTQGFILRRNVGDRLARFRQVDLDKPSRHHDALEFSNGKIVLVADLKAGQRAKVLQLPVDIDKVPAVIEPAAFNQTVPG